MVRNIFLFFLGIAYLMIAVSLSADLYSEIDDHLHNLRLSEASSLIRAALQEHPSDPELYLRLAAIFEYQGNYYEAITMLQSGQDIAGSMSAAFHYNIGNNYFALREYKEAENAYSIAIALDNSYARPYVNRANIRVQDQDYVNAIQDYTRYLEISPQGEGHAEVRRMIAVLRELLNAEEARERERALREKQLLDDALLLLGNSHTDGLNARAPVADIQELEDELDILY